MSFLKRELDYRPSWWIWALFAPALALLLLDIFDVLDLNGALIGAFFLMLAVLILIDRRPQDADRAPQDDTHG